MVPVGNSGKHCIRSGGGAADGDELHFSVKFSEQNIYHNAGMKSFFGSVHLDGIKKG
jgi:hypothetical protein